MMSGEAWLFLLSVLINAINLFLQVFFTIMYSDLEWYVHGKHPRQRPMTDCSLVITLTPSISATV